MSDNKKIVNPPCPNCGYELEIADYREDLLWSCRCAFCGWTDDRFYFRGPHNQLKLDNKEGARAFGLIVPCPGCGTDILWPEWDIFRMCENCHEKLAKKNKKKKKK